jgi:hypothetical protein
MRKTSLLLILSALAARASEVDSTSVIPIGKWNMSTKVTVQVDLSPLTANYGDILDVQVFVREDFANGDDEVYNGSPGDRLDRFPITYGNDFEGKGGAFYIQPVAGKLTLQLFADRGGPGTITGGPTKKFHANPAYSRETYVDSKGITRTMNRGFAVIRHKGLPGGFSKSKAEQRHFIYSLAVPMGPANFEGFDQGASYPVETWGYDVNPFRVVGFNFDVISNIQTGGKFTVRSMAQKPTSAWETPSTTPAVDYPAHLVLRNSGGSVNLFAGTRGRGRTFWNNAAYADNGLNRGWYYLNHYFASCDDFGYSPYAFSFVQWTSSSTGECAGGNNSYYVMQSKGSDIFWNADNGAFMYQSATGTNKTAQAKVIYVEKTSDMAKFGIAIRGGTAANSRYAGALYSPTNGVMFHWRATDGGATSRTKPMNIKAPVWVKVVKTGNVFRGEYSQNGTAWTTVKMDSNAGQTQTATISMGATYYQGLVGAANSATSAHATSGAYAWNAF